MYVYLNFKCTSVCVVIDVLAIAVQNYKVMISSTVPRPIALVSTASKDGTQTNLAPFSYFQNVSSDVSSPFNLVPDT